MASILESILISISKRTPIDEGSAYQSFPIPINVKDDTTVAIPSLHKSDKINSLPWFEQASPVFDSRKPLGQLRRQAELQNRKKRVFCLLGYANNYYRVKSLTEAVQQMTRKFFGHLVQLSDVSLPTNGKL